MKQPDPRRVGAPIGNVRAPVLDRPPTSSTWIEIDERALRENIRGLRREFEPAALCMVVKGNAYGHGYGTIVPIAEDEGVRDFAVFSAREAAGFLAASDGRSRLQLMGGGEPDNIPWLLERGVQPWITDANDWPGLLHAVDICGVPARVHLELETGMNRSGLRPDDALAVARAVNDHPLLSLEGVCTHLAGAEDPLNQDRIDRQKRVFRDFLETLTAEHIPWNRAHIASSSAGLLDPSARLDLVRCGIACYGLWPTPYVFRTRSERPQPPVLRNVLALKSRVKAIKDVPDGEYVGYGRQYEAEGPTTIGVVGIGYGDGFARALSSLGYVLIRGRRATIVGPVNMNMIQVHVSHIADARCGDEVVLIGRQGERQISVASFAEFNNVVNYELMARLSWEIPRIIVRGEPLRPPLQ